MVYLVNIFKRTENGPGHWEGTGQEVWVNEKIIVSLYVFSRDWADVCVLSVDDQAQNGQFLLSETF